jgi:hypothetical protein
MRLGSSLELNGTVYNSKTLRLATSAADLERREKREARPERR